MDCFQDFCLACDRESVDGPYCSQRCRMADLERASADLSPPQSPTTTTATTTTTTTSLRSPRYTSSTSASGSGYVLAPRFNSTSTQSWLWNQPITSARQQDSSYHVRASAVRQSSYSEATQPHSLTPSSSRSSLSSNVSVSSQSNNSSVSEQARLELQSYFSSFDQARAAKRRSSTR